jgi:hypothetical protein
VPGGSERTISRSAAAAGVSEPGRALDRGRPIAPTLGGTAQPGSAVQIELAADMPRRALERGSLPVGWVTASAAYGDAADLRALVAE